MFQKQIYIKKLLKLMPLTILVCDSLVPIPRFCLHTKIMKYINIRSQRNLIYIMFYD
jgi:hypothetical protein